LLERKRGIAKEGEKREIKKGIEKGRKREETDRDRESSREILIIIWKRNNKRLKEKVIELEEDKDRKTERMRD